MDPSGITAIIAVSLTGLTALVQALFHQMAQSRCIKLECGCIKCIRDPFDANELEIVNKQNSSSH